MKQNYYIALALVFITATLLIGCSKERTSENPQLDSANHPSTTSDVPKKPEKTFRVRATVTEVDREKGRLFLDHEKMDGYMEAMEMPFKVSDLSVFEKVKSGTKATFTIEVTDGIGVITDVTIDQ
jgi:Uncharacterized conserved protein